MLIRMRKAQSTAEYAILFALVVAAALGVQNYVRRALEARIRDAAEDFITETGGRQLQWEGQDGNRTTTNSISESSLEENFYEEGDEESVYRTREQSSSFDFESTITSVTD